MGIIVLGRYYREEPLQRREDWALKMDSSSDFNGGTIYLHDFTIAYPKQLMFCSL